MTTTVEFKDPRLPAKFWRNVRRRSNGCWQWTGDISAHGYGNYWVDGQGHVFAHRHAFHVLVRPLVKRGAPGHLQVDHECHNRSETCKGGPTCRHRRCVNPAHLSPRTPLENLHGSRHTAAHKNRAKTRCKRGHELAGDNLRVGPDGRRRCYTCHLARGSEARRQRLAEQRGDGWERRYWQTEKTHCPQGHPYEGENLYVDPASGMRGCRTCRANASARLQKRKREGHVPVANGAKTHCPQGHPLSGENLYTYGPDGRYRGCRECRRAAKLRHRGARVP